MKSGSLDRYRALEWNAYDTQSYVFKGLGSFSNDWLWEPKLDPAQAESQRQDFVNYDAENGAACGLREQWRLQMKILGCTRGRYAGVRFLFAFGLLACVSSSLQA